MTTTKLDISLLNNSYFVDLEQQIFNQSTNNYSDFVLNSFDQFKTNPFLQVAFIESDFYLDHKKFAESYTDSIDDVTLYGIINKFDLSDSQLGKFFIKKIDDHKNNYHDNKNEKHQDITSIISELEQRIAHSPFYLVVTAETLIKQSASKQSINVDNLIDLVYQKQLSTKFIQLIKGKLGDNKIPFNLKLVILGNEFDYHQLYELYPQLFLASHFYQQDFTVTSDNFVEKVNHLCYQLNISIQDPQVYQLLFFQLRRFYESNKRLEFRRNFITKLLIHGIEQQVVTYNKLNKYFQQQHFFNNREFIHEVENFIDKQLILADQASSIGQVNGLAVIENDDPQRSWGTVIRISALTNLFNETIHDIDSMVNLSGNFSTRGALISLNYLKSLVNNEDVIFSGSMVTEQLYSSTDGDSATIANFVAMISAMAKVPIKQNIAVTGAMDQFGNALVVGGINYKIEAFFKISQQLQIKNPTVILPRANFDALQLITPVIDAINCKQFHIYLVDHVSQACEIMTGMRFANDEILQNYQKADDDLIEIQDKFLLNEMLIQATNKQKQNGSWWKKIFAE